MSNRVEDSCQYCDCGGVLAVDLPELEMYCSSCGIRFTLPKVSNLAGTRKQISKARAVLTGFFTKILFSDDSHFEPRS